MKKEDNENVGHEEKFADPNQEINDNKTDPGSIFPQISQFPRYQQMTPQQDIPLDEKSLKLPKKSFPIKPILFGVLALILISIFGFILMRLRPSTPALFGNKGEVIWWGIQHDTGVYASLINEFEEKNPNVKITYIKQSTQDYRERLTNSLASGKGPDIFEIHNSWLPMYRDELSVLPEGIMGKDEYSKSFYPAIVSNLTLSKGIVAMPLEYDALTLFINEDIFASSLQRPPETWNELKVMVDPREARTLTLKDKEGRLIQSGAALGETENIDYWPEIIALMMFQNGVNMSFPSSQKMSDVLSFYSDFGQMKVWDDTLPFSTTAFAQGKVAMYFGPSRKATDIAKINSRLRFRTYPLPQLPKNNPTDPDFSYNTFWTHSVWERSSNKDLAWRFLRFLSEPPALERTNQNIKKYETFQIAYPRPEMNISLRDDKILGSIISLSLDSKSWYLADATNDGPKGINSQLKEIFKETLSGWRKGNEKALTDLQDGVQRVLNQYAIPLR